MSILIGSYRVGMVALFLAAGLANTVMSAPASATPIIDSHTYTLNVPNTDLKTYPAPFGTVKVNLNSQNKATVDFMSNTASNYYFFAKHSVAANVNGSFSLGSISGSPGINSSYIYQLNPTYVVSEFGKFDLVVNTSGHPATQKQSSDISFVLKTTKNNSWSSATDVLTPNNPSAGIYRVAAHIRVCSSSPCTTGYVADAFAVPEPASLAVLGVGLLGLAWLSGGSRRRHRSHT